jgi:hypothetical protein
MALKIALAASCAAAAAVLAAVVGPEAREGGPRPGRALSAQAAFEPAAAAFGDTVTARLSVVLDNRVFDPSTLHVTFPLAPLAVVGRTVRHRADRGDTTTITYAVSVACLGGRCVARGESATVSPAAPAVTVRRRTGATARVAALRPSLVVDRRVGAAAVAAARPPFRRDLGVPSISYRIAPRALTSILAVVAGLLAAAGGALAASAVVGRSRAASASRGSELARALALVRSAEARSAADRRRAVGLVARLLAGRNRALAETGDGLAWSRPPPSGESATGFADEVERSVGP